MILMAFMKHYSKKKVPLVKHLQGSKATIRPKNASILGNSVINHTKSYQIRMTDAFKYQNIVFQCFPEATVRSITYNQ